MTPPAFAEASAGRPGNGQLPTPERGDVAVALCGRSFCMRPTYQALSQIEAAIGPTVVVYGWLAGDRYGLGDLTVIAAAGITAWQRAERPGEPIPELEKIGEMIVETGLVPVRDACLAFLRQACTGGREETEAGEAMPAAGSA